MRLVTWNILHGRVPHGPVDLGALAEAAAGLEADVLGLQEVDHRHRRSHWADEARLMAKAAGMERLFTSTRRRGLLARSGNALLVRGEIEDTEVLDLPGHTGAERRRATLVTARLRSGTAVSVANCHLGLRSEAKLQLPVVIEALARRPAPRALVGDFNLRPDVVLPVVESAGFALTGGELTFPAREPDRRIDHVALAGLAAEAVEVRHLPVSDHRALVVDAQ